MERRKGMERKKELIRGERERERDRKKGLESIGVM